MYSHSSPFVRLTAYPLAGRESVSIVLVADTSAPGTITVSCASSSPGIGSRKLSGFPLKPESCPGLIVIFPSLVY